jgi:8-oxo-dGTP diphosphatase
VPRGVISGTWDGRRDRIHLLDPHLSRIPELTLDNREIIAARLATPDELRELKLSGPAAAYLTGSATVSPSG